MGNEMARMLWAQFWQVSLLILIVASLSRWLGRSRPHLTHALWVVVLVKAITPPVWSSPSGVFSWMQSPQSSEETAEADPPEVIPSAPVLLPQPIADVPDDTLSEALAPIAPAILMASEWEQASPILADEVIADSQKDVERIQPAITQTTETENSPDDSFWTTLLLAVWVTGALGSIFLALVRWLACWREIRRAGRVHDPLAQELLEELRTRLRVRRKVRLIISQCRIGPAVFGFFRPTVLIPARVMAGKSAADLEPILAHELIHIRRGDLWVGWLLVLVEGVWWFHPLVHFAGRWLKHEAERCCDEEVIAELGCNPARYARVLLNVLELKHVLKPVPVLPGVKPVEITSKRLERIMLLGQGCRKKTPWWCWLVMLLTAALTLPGAAFVAEAKDKTKRKERREEHEAPQANSSSARTQTYKVGDVMEKIKTHFGHPDEATARMDLATYLKLVVGEVWQEEQWLSSEKQVGTPSLSIKGNTLTVHHTPRVQAEIADQLKRIREHGYQEIVVEARILTASREVLENAVDSWEAVSSEIPAGDQPGTKPEMAHRQDFAVTAGNGLRTTVEKSTPMRMAILDESQCKRLIEACQSDARANLLQCPKVTVFNGQSATIQNTTQRPFVVGVSPDGKPALRVVSEGTAMKLRPVLDEKHIRLESQLTLSDIRNVEVVDLPKKPGEETPQKVQVPEVATTRINTTVKVPDGGSVLLGGLKLPDQESVPTGNNILLSSLGLAEKPQKQDQQLFVLLRVFHLKDRPEPGQWEESFEKAQAKARHENIPLLLYFHADWCGPCRTMERDVLLSSKFRSMVGYKFRVVKINIDQHRELATRFNIKSLPTTVLVSPDSKELDRIVGIQSLNDLVSRIEKVESRPNPPAALHHQSLPYGLVLNEPMGTRDAAKVARHADLQYQKALEAWRQAKTGGSEAEATRLETEFWRKRELWEQAEKELEVTKQRSGKVLYGVGVNSDAGLTGQIVLNEKNFETVTIDPPTNEEVLEAVRKESKQNDIPHLRKMEYKNITINKERISQFADPPRVYPQVGLAQRHTAHFKCLVTSDVQAESEWPVPMKNKGTVSQVVYIDKTVLVPAKQVSGTTDGSPESSKDQSDLESRLLDRLRTNRQIRDDSGYSLSVVDVQGKTLIKPTLQCPSQAHGSVTLQAATATLEFDAEKQLITVHLVQGYIDSADNRRIWFEKESKPFSLPQSLDAVVKETPKDQVVPSAAYLADDVQYFPVPPAAPKVQSAKSWEDLTQQRMPSMASETEKAIENKLAETVSLRFVETPLSEVIKQLSKQEGMNILVDNLGLEEEGVKADHPISIDVEDVKLSTALKLILEPLNLCYVIQDEVLKITSKTRIETATITTVTYPVADLVIPVPQRITVDLREHRANVAPQNPKAPEATKADFDELTQLILSTVQPDSWSKNGGWGSLRTHQTTLSLVVRQSQKIHEELRELLQQLRRLQDLQVSLAIRTIEVESLEDKELAKKLASGKLVSLTPDEVEALKISLNKNTALKSWDAPKVTFFNGQTAHVIFPALDQAGFGVDVHPFISPDRRFVRLGLRTNTEAPPEEQSNTQSLLKDGHSVLLNVTKGGGKTIVKGMKLSLVTPTIIVQEEEEELLGIPTK